VIYESLAHLAALTLVSVTGAIAVAPIKITSQRSCGIAFLIGLPLFFLVLIAYAMYMPNYKVIRHMFVLLILGCLLLRSSKNKAELIVGVIKTSGIIFVFELFFLLPGLDLTNGILFFTEASGDLTIYAGLPDVVKDDDLWKWTGFVSEIKEYSPVFASKFVSANQIAPVELGSAWRPINSMERLVELGWGIKYVG
jgi:hypothetical protein